MLMNQLASLQKAYETLSDTLDAAAINRAAARNKEAGPTVADSDDIPEDRLLVLCAMKAVEALALRGYLEILGDPDDSRRLTFTLTERGSAALEKASWAEFPSRPGDIIISTAPKSGTTWMQMICALLIFQTPELPASIPELSPWLESQWPEERARGRQQFAAQQHRRFIKTHRPLKEIPIDPQVTYIVVARNPLDVMVSMHYQGSVLLAADDLRQPDDSERPRKSARQCVLDNISEMGTTRSLFNGILEDLSYAWERRAEPNIVLVHYEDLSTDLQGEMRRLAKRLQITVPEDNWPSLVQAATFEQMRAAADQLQPLKYSEARDASRGYEAFFRRGSSGDGRALLTESEADRYYTQAAQIAPQELLAWLHRDDEHYALRE